jgi:hypothetical protein
MHRPNFRRDAVETRIAADKPTIRRSTMSRCLLPRNRRRGVAASVASEKPTKEKTSYVETQPPNFFYSTKPIFHCDLELGKSSTAHIIRSAIPRDQSGLQCRWTGCKIHRSALINPWGIARSSTGAWWVADEDAHVSTLYNGEGVAVNAQGAPQPLVVTIPHTRRTHRKVALQYCFQRQFGL